MSDNKQFPDLNSKPNFSEIEKEILDFWDKDETFETFTPSKKITEDEGVDFPTDI